MSGRLRNLAHECRYGIRTRGVVPIDNPDSVHYGTLSYRTINKVLDALDLGPADTLLDIGCGKGRVLCSAARRRLAQVIGIELNPALVQAARENAAALRGRRTPVTVHQGFAQDADYGSATVIYMFEPFGADTLRKVLAKIRQDRDGRPIRMAYANPGQGAQALAEAAWLERYAYWEAAARGLEHPVVFLRTAGPTT